MQKITGKIQVGNNRLRVLFLNTRDSLGADVAVHLSIASKLNRNKIGVWAATSIYEAPGTSARAIFEAIPELTVLTLELGRPLSGQNALGRVIALLHNVKAIFTLFRLAWLCWREKISIIHVTERPRDALFGLILARLAGSAYLIHAHTGYDRRNISSFGNWVLHQADGLVCVSQFTANSYLNNAGFPRHKVFTVLNAVDSSVFRPDRPLEERLEMRRRLGIPVDKTLIGCVARLSRWKDQESLLEALSELRTTVPNAHVVLAGVNSDSSPDGRGSYKDYLLRRIDELGLEDSVTFSGFLPYQEMPKLYNALDVLVHPALEEPFGLAIVEGMASGRPVVAVCGGGVLEIIRNDIEGLLIEFKQPVELANAIRRLLHDPVLAKRLAQAGRERVQTNFTPEIQANRMLEVYSQLATRQAG